MSRYSSNTEARATGHLGIPLTDEDFDGDEAEEFTQPREWALDTSALEGITEVLEKHSSRLESFHESLPDDDRQVGGDHYRSMDVQPWEAMEAWLSREAFEGFLRGNAIKYLARAGAKGDPHQDYEKAEHYLSKLLSLSRPDE